MPAVTYFEHPLMPGVQHFQCSATRCSLSIASCAAQFRRAKAEVSGSACRGCVIGAEHAGEAAATIPRHLCPRCGRTGQRIVLGQICVSCYNRQRELLVGRNSKGTFPHRAQPVFAAEIQVGAQRIRFDRVASIGEAVLVAIQRHPGASVVPLGRL